MITMTERPLCPDPETLGVFAEGTATPETRRMVLEHLATCNDCLEEVGEVPAFERESGANVIPMRRTGAGRWGGWLAAAAVLVVVAGAGGWWRFVRDPADALREALPKDNRMIDPMLYGFAPNRYSTMRGSEESGSVKLEGVAGSIILDATNSSSVKQRHAAALAKLFLSKTKPDYRAQAILDLEALVKEHPDDARLLSDLGAALFWDAEMKRGSYDKALSAVDRALKLDPSLREARFNRALIRERLDPPATARATWLAFLRGENDPAWREQAFEHYKTFASPQ
jgi:putative zinc finger protein